MEYGWNRVLSPLGHTSAILDDELSLSDKMDSFSIRSGKSGGKKRSMEGAATVGRTYDRIMIHEWKPPLPPSVSSMHDEETQLEALQKQVELLNNDLQSHNELRKPMTSLVSERDIISFFMKYLLTLFSVRLSVHKFREGADKLGEKIPVLAYGNC